MGNKDPQIVGKQLDRAGNTLYRVITAGTHTTAGGDASETIVDEIVESTDIVMVGIKTEGSSPVTCDAFAAGSGQITVTMSGDPSTDHVLQYVVFRRTDS